ncbi:MAG: hypothetical protein K2Y15_00440 [Burkholderiaceae bacterium]|jgi:hypothetical protein|nr:hypothetical protein [Burkholderiaceae bacterium]
MKHRRLCILFLLTLPALPSAQTVVTPAQLPLRNLLIEVRQDDGRNDSSERVAADVNARVQPGRSEVDVAIEARRRESIRSGSAQQQVLVLNGRPTAISLGSSVPLRLRQFIVQNGIRRSVPGTVWVQAGTGFMATPVWEGGDSVYLELVATQGRQPLGPQASTSTTLMLPLDEWTTIADSEDVQDQRQNAAGLGGGGRDTRSSSQSLRVQVRVSVR